MLRGTERKETLESLSRARTCYESQATDTQTAITDLFLLRQKCSKDLIARGEHFVNRLANTPKEFDKSWSELKAEIAEFDDVVEKLEEEYRASHVGKSTAAAVLPWVQAWRRSPRLPHWRLQPPSARPLYPVMIYRSFLLF